MGRGTRDNDAYGRRPRHCIGSWLSDSVPVVIERDIPSFGIFPKLSREEAERAARGYAPIDEFEAFDFKNYASYEEQVVKADAELERERVAGYLITGDRATLESIAGGPLERSRVRVIVKEKAGSFRFGLSTT